jgi:hypothetical protein
METANKKASGYTPELTAKVIELYRGGMSVKDIAVQVNKPVRSVTGKLVSEKVYVKPEVPTKPFVDNGPTKKEILKRLEALNLSEEVIKGLTNATKGALEVVADRLEAANSEGVEAEVESVEQAA